MNKDFCELEYTNDPDFKRYVDRYCVKHRVSLSEALDHDIVHEVAKAYVELGSCPQFPELIEHEAHYAEDKSC